MTTTASPIDVLRDASPGQGFRVTIKGGETVAHAEPVSVSGTFVVVRVGGKSRALKASTLASVEREVDKVEVNRFDGAPERKPLAVKRGTHLARMMTAFARAGDNGTSDYVAACDAGLAATGYWKRASDLRRAGLVEFTGQRVTIAGKHVRTSKATDRGRTLAVELGWIPGQ